MQIEPFWDKYSKTQKWHTVQAKYYSAFFQVTNWLWALHDAWNQGIAVIENNMSEKNESFHKNNKNMIKTLTLTVDVSSF